MKCHKQPLYQQDTTPTSATEKIISANCARNFQEPFYELFIWAVLTKRQFLNDKMRMSFHPMYWCSVQTWGV